MKKKAKSGQCFVLQSILMVYRNDNWGASLSFRVALPEKNQTHTHKRICINILARWKWFRVENDPHRQSFDFHFFLHNN